MSDDELVEGGEHAGRAKKVKIVAPKNIDYKAFGRTLNNYMNDKEHTSKHLAAEIGEALLTRLHKDQFEHEGLIESMRAGHKTSPEAVVVVAEALKLEIPIATAPPEKRSPFGDRGKKAQGGHRE